MKKEDKLGRVRSEKKEKSEKERQASRTNHFNELASFSYLLIENSIHCINSSNTDIYCVLFLSHIQ